MPGAGDLDRRIVIERATSTPNAFNEPVLTWGTYATLWAGRKDVSDGEKMAAGQVGAFLQSRFVVRYSTTANAIRPTDRLAYDGGHWNITGIKETVDGRNRFLELTCVRDMDAPEDATEPLLSLSFEQEEPVATVTGHGSGFDGDPNDLLIYVSGAKWILTASGLIVAGTTLRTEFDADGNALGLLIEPARTNRLTHSDAFDNAVWSNSMRTNVTANSGTAPDGTPTADLIVPTTEAGAHFIRHNVTQFSGVEATRSLFLKSAGYRYFGIGRAANDGSRPIVFDIATGEIVQAATVDAFTGSILAYGNGWFRPVVHYDGTLASALNPRYYFYTDDVSFPVANNTVDAAGDGESGFLAWRAQLESAADVSSPIQTEAAEVTRPRDDIQIPLTAFPWNSGNGVLTLNGEVVGPVLSGSDLDIAATVLAAGEAHLKTLTWVPS